VRHEAERIVRRWSRLRWGRPRDLERPSGPAGCRHALAGPLAGDRETTDRRWIDHRLEIADHWPEMDRSPIGGRGSPIGDRGSPTGDGSITDWRSRITGRRSIDHPLEVADHRPEVDRPPTGGRGSPAGGRSITDWRSIDHRLEVDRSPKTPVPTLGRTGGSPCRAPRVLWRGSCRMGRSRRYRHG
jgi:hypothetical protein